MHWAGLKIHRSFASLRMTVWTYTTNLRDATLRRKWNYIGPGRTRSARWDISYRIATRHPRTPDVIVPDSHLAYSRTQHEEPHRNSGDRFMRPGLFPGSVQPRRHIHS